MYMDMHRPIAALRRMRSSERHKLRNDLHT